MKESKNEVVCQSWVVLYREPTDSTRDAPLIYTCMTSRTAVA